MNGFLLIIRYLFYVVWIPAWWLQIFIPRKKNIWVFGSWHGKEYSDNSKLLYEHIVNNYPQINAIWLTRSKEVEQFVKGSYLICSIKGIILSLRAGVVVFSSGNTDVNRFFINGAKIIQTWHGAPMKKIGADDLYHYKPLKNSILKIFFPFVYKYNQHAVISTAKVFNEKLSTAFKTNNIWLTGYPRNDTLFSKIKSPSIERINGSYDNPRKIMYLPTFRDHNKNFQPFEKYNFDEIKWTNYLEETNSVIITKIHFAMQKSFKGSKSNRIIHLNKIMGDDLNLILKDIDILITDYSGVFFDFLILNKPIVLACFDLDEYQKKSRDLYFDYENEIIGTKCNNWEEVLLALDQKNFIKYNKQYIKRFNNYTDNKSCERLTNKIIELTQ